MVLKTVPLLAPELGEAAMKLDESLGSVSMRLKAVPNVANTASSMAKKVNICVPFWKCGDLQAWSRYITTGKALKYYPNIKKSGWR